MYHPHRLGSTLKHDDAKSDQRLAKRKGALKSAQSLCDLKRD
jgi:hypothetical protein